MLEFELKDLTKLRYFLGIEVAHLKLGLILKQRKYILNFLKKTRKLNCYWNQSQDEYKRGWSIQCEGKCMYQSLIGKFIYLTLTRPKITYTVNVVSQFMHVSINTYLANIQKILCYLKKILVEVFYILKKIPLMLNHTLTGLDRSIIGDLC